MTDKALGLHFSRRRTSSVDKQKYAALDDVVPSSSPALTPRDAKATLPGLDYAPYDLRGPVDDAVTDAACQKSAPRSAITRCRVRRVHGDKNKLFVYTENEHQEQALIYAARTHRAVLGGGNFTIQTASGTHLGDMQKRDSHYVVYGGRDAQTEVAIVSFESTSGNPARTLVTIPSLQKDGTSLEITPGALAAHGNQHSSDVLLLRSKEPRWNPIKKYYELDFNGRAGACSVKNFQLVVPAWSSEEVVFQFGRLNETDFALDFRFPVNLLQAFGFALARISHTTI